jgi:hypothetical protein
VDNEAKLASFFGDTVRIPQIVGSFTDTPTESSHALEGYPYLCFLMPMIGLTALLARVLHWLDQEESRKTLLAPRASLNARAYCNDSSPLNRPPDGWASSTAPKWAAIIW